jgi:hypothetical protein
LCDLHVDIVDGGVKKCHHAEGFKGTYSYSYSILSQSVRVYNIDVCSGIRGQADTCGLLALKKEQGFFGTVKEDSSLIWNPSGCITVIFKAIDSAHYTVLYSGIVQKWIGPGFSCFSVHTSFLIIINDTTAWIRPWPSLTGFRDS